MILFKIFSGHCVKFHSNDNKHLKFRHNGSLTKNFKITITLAQDEFGGEDGKIGSVMQNVL